ncbi:MAG: ABC transporter permease [Treponema sp.]|nr:ABC transporter permease [Treponema sp.]
MRNFIIKRIFKGIVTIWFIWSLVFVMVRISGDPVEWMLPDNASVAVADELRSSLGLDLPLYQQYIKSFTNLISGDMGTSYFFRRPVADLYAQRIGATLMIGIPSFILSTFLGILLGVLAAVKHNTIIDRSVMTFAITFYTIPGFAFAILLVLFFSLWLGILPSGNMGTWRHMVMPIIAMTVGPMATVARLTRSSLLDALKKEYLDAARMKGVKEHVVVLKHALRNSLIPVVTSVGMRLGQIISGAAVVETVFGWPGIGTLLVTAASRRDFPTVQYGVLVVSVFVTVAMIMVDISYGWLDPRIRDTYK